MSTTKAQVNLLDEIIVDNFAGGGGASTGMELATGKPVAIAINHDPAAILMHRTNHPYTEHLQASVWDVDPEKVTGGRPVVQSRLQAFFQGKRGGIGRPKCPWPCMDRPSVGRNGTATGHHFGKRGGISDLGAGAEGKTHQEKVRGDIPKMEAAACQPGL